MYFYYSMEASESYNHWAMLRTMLGLVTTGISHSADANSATHDEFETLQLIAHYLASRAAYKQVPALKPLATKISIALLRYADVLPADRAFYEAGEDCKVFLIIFFIRNKIKRMNIYMYVSCTRLFICFWIQNRDTMGFFTGIYHVKHILIEREKGGSLP